MIHYDDKTQGAIKSGTQMLIQSIDSDEDITFKASYVVAADLKCAGKITALFDLIVFGNIDAEEIDVKGRLVCMGNCDVSGSIVVQDDIWAENIHAISLTSHDKIVAQSIDADIVQADGNIIIGKTLAVEEKAQTYQKVICGETAYGAGKIIASTILTSEPLDLDDGEEAIESPYTYIAESKTSYNEEIQKCSIKYAKENDYIGFLAELTKIHCEDNNKAYDRYLKIFKTMDTIYPTVLAKVRDVSLLIGLMELSKQDYFKDWPRVIEWTEAMYKHFRNIVEGKFDDEQGPQPAEKLEKGYVVLHKKYGQGKVRTILYTNVKGKTSQMAVVDFEEYGEKKFPLPDSLKFFWIINEGAAPTVDKLQASLECNIGSYSEWLSALQLINEYKEFLGAELYEVIYGLLLAKLGLKAKFVDDRFKEKGWG